MGFMNIEMDPLGEEHIVDYIMEAANDKKQFQIRAHGLQLQLAINVMVACVFSRNLYFSIKMLVAKPRMFAGWCCLISSILGVSQGVVFAVGFLSGKLGCRVIYWFVILVVGVITTLNNAIMLHKAYLALRRRRWIIYIGGLCLLPQLSFSFVVLVNSNVGINNDYGCTLHYEKFIPWYWFGSSIPISIIFSGIFSNVAYKQYCTFGSDAWMRLARDGLQTMCLAVICNILCGAGTILEIGGQYSAYFFFADCLIISVVLVHYCISISEAGTKTTRSQKKHSYTTNIDKTLTQNKQYITCSECLTVTTVCSMHKAYTIHSLLDNLPLTLSGLAFDDTRIYIATSTGTLIVYEIKATSKAANDEFDVLLLESKKKFSSRPIDQIDIVPECNLIISLSDSYINLHDQKTLELKQQLKKSNGTLLFSIAQQKKDNGDIQVRIAASLRKRLLIFVIENDQIVDTTEYSIPDRARAMAWFNDDHICVGYGKDYIIVNVDNGKTNNVFASLTTNNPAPSVSYASSAFSVMGAAISAARGVTPLCVKLPDNEVCIIKDNVGIFVDSTGQPTRKGGIHWTTAPEIIKFSFPYIITLVNKQLEIRNYKTLTLVQTVSVPMMRYLVADTLIYGASIDHIWRIQSTPLMDQVDQLVAAKEFDEAISLLLLMEDRDEPNSAQRLTDVKKRYSLHLFSNRHDERAFSLFNKLDIDPREVISLFMQSISGTLSDTGSNDAKTLDIDTILEEKLDEDQSEFREALSCLIQYLAEKRRWLARAIQTQNDLEQLPSNSDHKSPKSPRSPNTTITSATPVQYKSERAFSASPPSVSGRSLVSTLAELSLPEQQKLPPLSELKQMAEAVDTTLLRAYIATKDGLVGSLLRVKNYCIIEDSKKLLMKHKKYKELIDFYKGKQLHRLALQLLAQLGIAEDGPMSGCEPTVQYLQRLGIDYIDLIWEFSIWVLQKHPERGLTIFTEDVFEVDTLPHDQVLDHLEEVSEVLAVQYLEHLINDLCSVSPQFHTRLAELYLVLAKEQNEYVTVGSTGTLDDNATEEMAENKSSVYSVPSIHKKLLNFLETSLEYKAERILAQLPNDGFWEERALLLGRIGQHTKALTLYARKLNDYKKAEDYCRQQSSHDVFVTLLKIYLQPKQDEPILLEPALQLLNSPNALIDAAEAASLLPPDTQLSLVKDCMQKYIRSDLSSSRMRKVVRSLSDVTLLYTQENLAGAQAKRVIISEDRMCMLCGRRIGMTAFATFPNGGIFHYSCKERLVRLNNV
ncbi:hypothetical protein BDF19DRAFT_412394 [Syncephalis fuscata]|nr:hypothetical protein BDF19DRAFT_412394 [Syncephalis fuscata]